MDFNSDLLYNSLYAGHYVNLTKLIHDYLNRLRTNIRYHKASGYITNKRMTIIRSLIKQVKLKYRRKGGLR